MEQIENNVVYSFNLAKSDIMSNRRNIVELAKSQNKLIDAINKLKAKNLELERQLALKEVVKTASTKATANYVRHKKSYVSSKGSSKFHVTSCPFAKNIQPKNREKFSLKNTALNHGFKPCKCV